MDYSIKEYTSSKFAYELWSKEIARKLWNISTVRNHDSQHGLDKWLIGK